MLMHMVKDTGLQDYNYIILFSLVNKSMFSTYIYFSMWTVCFTMCIPRQWLILLGDHLANGNTFIYGPLSEVLIINYDIFYIFIQQEFIYMWIDRQHKAKHVRGRRV